MFDSLLIRLIYILVMKALIIRSYFKLTKIYTRLSYVSVFPLNLALGPCPSLNLFVMIKYSKFEIQEMCIFFKGINLDVGFVREGLLGTSLMPMGGLNQPLLQLQCPSKGWHIYLVGIFIQK